MYRTFEKGITRLKKSKLFINTGWLISERIIDMIITLFIGIYTTRYLGPENYGLLNYSLSFIALFTFISNLGLDAIIIKELVNRKKQEGLILGTSILMRMLSSLLSIVLILLLVKFLHWNNDKILLIALLQSLSLLFNSFEVINLWFQWRLESKKTIIAKTSVSVIIGLLKLSLIASSSSVEWFAIAVSINSLLISIILISIYYRSKGLRLRFSLEMGRILLSQSYNFILSGMIMVIYTQMDRLMIGWLMDDASVGYYTAATTVSNLWFFIPYAIINSARSTIIEAKNISNDVFEGKLKRLYSIIIWMGIFVGVFFTIFSGGVVNLLYGNQYAPAAQPLTIIVWAGIFALLGVARDIWYVSENRMKYSKVFVMWGALINVILNLLFIPIWGIDGSAIATLTAQMVVVLIAPFFYKEVRRSSVLMLESMFSRWKN